MMTLDEMQLAVCEKLPDKVELVWGAKGEGDHYIWKNTEHKINWPTEGLQVCHEAEKLLTGDCRDYVNHLILSNGVAWCATYEQRLEALCRVWFPERF